MQINKHNWLINSLELKKGDKYCISNQITDHKNKILEFLTITQSKKRINKTKSSIKLF